ncbi:uncharacterized protein TNCV_3323641 [Trichonephila clavipes]|nr:uncharacterized protein TNCV_3323641 [Trichonephila clavipes]
MNISRPMWSGIISHKTKSGPIAPRNRQTHMGKDHLLTMAIPVTEPPENVELSPPFLYNYPGDNSRTTLVVSFRDVTGVKPSLELSPNQVALRIACGTETTLSLIRKEDTTLLMRCPVFVFLTPL